MEKKGSIYLIYNDINDKKYVGQTKRDVNIRFNEHCFDKRSTSKIHKAIQELGYNNFHIKTLETVPYSQLNEREKYWVEYYDCYNNGYNSTIDGQSKINGKGSRYYKQILVEENGFIFDSIESMSRDFARTIGWTEQTIKNKIIRCLNEQKDFYGYHLKQDYYAEELLTSIDDIEAWIKDLNIEFTGHHIYCIELDKHFESKAEAAIYLLENNYWTLRSNSPIQTLLSAISKSINKDTIVSNTTVPLHFIKEYGTKKNSGSVDPFKNKQIYVKELDKNFNSIIDCAHYLQANGYFTDITEKTLKSRISDVARGYFQEYKGYHFFFIDDNGQKIITDLYKIQKKYFLQEEENIDIQPVIKVEKEVIQEEKKKVKHGTWTTYKDLADKYLELKSLGKVAKYYSASRETVKKACKQYNIPIISQKEQIDKNKKPILVKYDGKEQYFDSINAAVKYFNFPDSSVRRSLQTGKLYLNKYLFLPVEQ